MEILDTLENGENTLQITTIGTVVGSAPDGSPVEQNFSEDALKAIAEAQADDELLIDVDHESELGASTKAAGWLSKLKFIPGKGLTGIAKWTSIGKELIANRIYRFVSPTFWLNKETKEPMALRSVALTNRPAQAGRIAPIINCESFPTGMIPITLNCEEEDILKTMTKDELMEWINSAIDEKLKILNSCPDEKPEDEVKNEEEVKEEVKEEVETEKTEETTSEETTSEETTPAPEEEKKEEVIKEEVLNSEPTAVQARLNPLNTLHGKALFEYVSKHPYGV